MRNYLSILLVWGCQSETDKPTDDTGSPPEQATEHTDADGDGFAEDDCDDANADVHPGAQEVCDNLDNDCNGHVDDGAIDAQVFHADNDGDGFGSNSESSQLCQIQDGWLSDSSDCDDENPDIHPETWWFDDSDGDGFGDDSTGAQQCEAPGADWVLDNTDCDDADRSIHPNADELCDTLDNNCDGSIDDETSTDTNTYYRDSDGDGWGQNSDIIQSCWQPTGYQDVPWDCDDYNDAIHPLALEVCGDTTDDDCSGRLDNGCSILDLNDVDHVAILGEASLGIQLRQLGDISGDASDDLLVSDPDADGGAGRVYTLEGPFYAGEYDAETRGLTLVTGNESEAQLGRKLEWSDLDGDGADDLVVAATLGEDGGLAHIFYGPVGSGLDSSQADATVSLSLLTGPRRFDRVRRWHNPTRRQQPLCEPDRPRRRRLHRTGFPWRHP